MQIVDRTDSTLSSRADVSALVDPDPIRESEEVIEDKGLVVSQ